MKPGFTLALYGQDTAPIGADSTFVVSANGNAVEYRDRLLAESGFIEAVTCLETQRGATNAAALLKALAKDAEAARKELKDPFLNGGRAIDAAVQKYIADVKTETARLEGLLADYQRAETERAAKIRAEQDKIAGEIAEQAAWDGDVPFFPAEAYQPPPKTEGAAVKADWKVEVTDIHAFYRWNRNFCRLEIDMPMLKGYLNLPNVDPNSIPGITATKNIRVEVRAAKSE